MKTQQSTTNGEDNQVRLVLERLQPPPAFLASSTTRKKGNQNNKHDYFASALYKDKKLQLIYLYSNPLSCLRLEFHVETTTRPYQIQYVPDSYIHKNCAQLQAELNPLCHKLSSHQDHSSSTLFAIVSKLLMELQKLKRTLQSRRPQSKSTNIKHHLLQRLKQSPKTSWDLPLLLMRCATTSKRSTQVCTPLPRQLEATRDSRPPALVLHYIRDSLLNHNNQQIATDEQAMMEFLACLQWTDKVQLSLDNNVPNLSTVLNTKNNHHTTPTPTKIQQARQAVRMTLDLTQARDPSPRYTQQALEPNSSVMKAYHGTELANVWSILNFGLQPTNSKLQVNGALMGPGVYLTDKYDVAYYFATTNGNAQKGLPLSHWLYSQSFWNLLDNNLLPKFVLEFKQECQKHQSLDWTVDVTCYAVAECSIIVPTTNNNNNHMGARRLPSDTKQEGHYYAVPNPHDNLHLQKVHLTFEFHRRRKLASFLGGNVWIRAGICLSIVLLLWRILQQ